MVLPASPLSIMHPDVPERCTVVPEKVSGAECGPYHLPARGKTREDLF